MDQAANRRGFLRLLANGAARGARELTPGAGLVQLVGALPEAAPPRPSRPPAAEPTTETIGVERLAGMSRELGLESRLEDLRRLARTGARLTPAGAGRAAGFAGGRPSLPDDVSWPLHGGVELEFLAALDLAQLGTVTAPAGRLPESGGIWIFATTAGDEAVVRVLFGTDPPPPPPPNGVALCLSGELQLPRAWSAEAEELSLSDAERIAWQGLREQLAELQGVAAIDGGPAPAPIHRVLGYPDVRRGDLAVRCELRARGADPGGPPYEFADRGAARRWWPLAQLDADPGLGWSWGPGRRIYVWATAGECAGSRPAIVEAVLA